MLPAEEFNSISDDNNNPEQQGRTPRVLPSRGTDGVGKVDLGQEDSDYKKQEDGPEHMRTEYVY